MNTKKRRPIDLPLEHFLSKKEPKQENVRLSCIEYTDKEFIEKENTTIEECLKYIETPYMTWIQVEGVSDPATIAAIGKYFKLHHLILEDIVNTSQRAKLETYQDQIFIIARLLYYEEAEQTLKDKQVSIVFGPNYLISFLENHEKIFDPIKEHLRQGHPRIRSEKADYLAYALLDSIVDSYFIILEQIDTYLDGLEDKLLHPSNSYLVQKIQHAKRTMIVLRHAVWPMRDVINRFMHLEHISPQSATKLYLQDVYDHTVQTIDIIEGFRDVVSGMMDIYLSNINIRTNDIMKLLTMVSTIFVPLTFIASIYGMNFEHMPELHIRWYYPFILAVMLMTAIGMLFFFRRKKWI